MGGGGSVFIATNNRSHAPLAQKAMEAGKHCLVEKPIATTLDDARRLQQLARQRQVSLAVDHMMTENAYNQRARELVAAGAIGEVNDISLHMEFCYGSTPNEAATWRCADPLEIGGPVGDVGSHCLYMAEFLLNGTVKSLSCVYTPRTLNIAVENGAFVHFRLDTGVQGTAQVAFNRPRGGLGGTLTNLGYEIYGTKGSAILVEPFEPANAIRLCLEEAAGDYEKGVNMIQLRQQHRDEAHELELKSFVATIRGEQAPDRPLSHELLVQETLLRATGGVQ